MPVMWICVQCGNHHPDGAAPPDACVICTDERQWVHPRGQRWTTLEDLASQGHVTEVREVEPGLLGLAVNPGVGIGQRGLLVRSDGGNLLWDPPGFLDEAGVERVRAAGGLAAVTASHPHFYGAMAEWARRLDAEVLVPEADAHWVTNPTSALRTWRNALEVLPGITLIQCGGHFPGSAVVHWAQGADGAGVLLTGDTIFVTPGGDRITFVWSAPNRLPLPAAAVRRVVDALRPYAFDRIYYGWWEPVLHTGAKQVLQTSAERYIEIMAGGVPT